MMERRVAGAVDPSETEADMLRFIGCVVLILIGLGLLVAFGVLKAIF